MTARYWITPPNLYEALAVEFNFDFDPCPYPRAPDYNSLVLPWGESNYVNPPFCKKDAPFGGPSAFARKAIAEQAAGNTSVIILPVPNSIGLLLEAGAELRYGGKIRWLEADTKEPCPRAYAQAIAILKGAKE
jgi:hypothetical protein